MASAILYDNKVAAAALTDSGSEPLLTAGNLASDDLSRVWRTPADTESAWVLAAFGSSVSIAAVVLVDPKGIGTARIRLSSTGDDDGSTGDVYDSDATGPAPAIVTTQRWMVQLLPQAYSASHLRVDLDQAGSDRIEAAMLLAGPVWQPTLDYLPGIRLGRDDQDESLVSRGGVEWVTLGGQRRRWSGFRFPALTEAERTTHADALAAIGRRKPIVFCRNTAGSPVAAYTMVGRLQAPVEPLHAFTTPAGPRFSLDLDLAELI